MKRLTVFFIVSVILLAFSSNTAPVQAQSDTSEVIVLEASGAVVPAFGSYIERGITIADERNVEAVVLVLNTPGGNGQVMADIVQAMLNSDVPIIVFVGPRGAMAGSAGLFITLAGHASAMAPETAIGASSPVSGSGDDLPTTLEEKFKEYWSAQARSMAERRGEEAVQIAQEAVFEARAVSASEAYEAHLVDFLVEDVDDLLAEIDGFEVIVNDRARTLKTAGATVTPVPMSMLEQFLILITHPNIVALLLSIGPIAIIIEIRAPGGWVLGAIGVICVGLALYGAGALPINWLGLIFIVLAIALFIVEIKAPIHGIPTAAGVASMAVGLIVLFSDPNIEPFGELSIPLVVGQSIILGSVFFFLGYMALRAMKLQPVTGYEGLIGQIGRTTSDLDPRGTVLIAGERWRAESESGHLIPEGSDVEIIEAENFRLKVRPPTL